MITHKPERFEDESYLEYQVRRDLSRAYIKDKKRGRLIWDSRKHGTYINPERQRKKARLNNG